MKSVAGKNLLIFLTVFNMLLLTACSSVAPQVEAPTLAPVVYVTQFVTQVVATSLPDTPTPIPTFTQSPPPTYAGWDPLAQPIYYPVMGCAASRIHLGDRAYVAYISGIAGLYTSNNVLHSPLKRKPIPGEVVEIVDGPWCSGGAIVWLVNALADEETGYMPEGNGQEYWLLPLQPPTPTPD